MTRVDIWGLDAGNFAQGQIIWSALNAIRPAKTAPPSLIDLSKLRLMRPYTVAAIAALGSMSDNKADLVLPDTQDARDYVLRVGLGDFFRVGEASPLSASPRAVGVRRLQMPSSTFADEITTVWEREFGSLPSGLRPRLANHLDEMIRNALAHAGSTIGCIVAAQVYPRTKTVEIAILDVGQTIRTHLVKNPLHKHIPTDDAAIIHATGEGVSGTLSGTLNALGEPNSGIGLFELRQYCECGGGEVTIVSGNAMVTFQEGAIPLVQHVAGGFPGCLVNIRFFV